MFNIRSALRSWPFLLASLLDVTSASPFQTSNLHRRQAGTFRPSLSQCPSVPPRSAPPTSVHDLRPDDFSVTMAIGDSISAGWLSRGLQPLFIHHFSEWRGESYAAGGDPGAITIPNLIKHYKPSLTGASLGRNVIPEICYGPFCPNNWNRNVDQLNAARPGALASNLMQEVSQYLVPEIRRRNIPDSQFKYLNLQIGSNDICLLCAPSLLGHGPTVADRFEEDIDDVLDYIRTHIPNTFVNFIGVFKASDIYPLTKRNKDYCDDLFSPIEIPHANLECPCALFDGPAGDTTRTKMDELQIAYNERIIKVVKKYQELRDPGFAVVYQPANVPLGDYPIESLSKVDCFHPSLKSHRFIASEMWRRLVGDQATKAEVLTWRDDLSFRCLEEGDRMPTDGLL